MHQPSVSASGVLFSRRIYFPRIVGNAFGFLFVAFVLVDKAVPLGIWAIALLHGFAWPHFGYQIARRSANPFKAECRNFFVDSFLAGFWVGAMEFNTLPSVLFLSIMNMNNIAAGGGRLVVRGFAMQLLGIVLSSRRVGLRLCTTN